MARERVDGFAGNKRSYVGYLYELLTGYSTEECILRLEEARETARQSELSALIQPNNQLGTRARCHNSQIPHSPMSSSGLPQDRSLPASGVQIVFEHWNPNIEYEARRVEPKRTKWPTRTATFIASLPKSEDEWRKKRRGVGTSTEGDILNALDSLINTPSTEQPLAHNNSDRPERRCTQRTEISKQQEFQETLCSFARSAGSAVVAGNFARNASRFQTLVFVAICCVALHEGHPENLVNDAQLLFLRTSRPSCTAGETLLARHRSTVRWLLQEQQRQFRRGLLHRAFEIFYNEGKDLYFYTDCPKEPEDNEIFTSRFPVCRPPGEIQASLPFWIPFFVQFQICGRWSYTTVCTALGVDLLSREEDFHAFQDTYRSRKLVVRRLAIDHPNPPGQARKLRNRQAIKPHGTRRNVAPGTHTQVCSVLNSQLVPPPGEAGLRTQSPSDSAPLTPQSNDFSLSGSAGPPDMDPTSPRTGRCTRVRCSPDIERGHPQPIDEDNPRPAKRRRTRPNSSEGCGYGNEQPPRACPSGHVLTHGNAPISEPQDASNSGVGDSIEHCGQHDRRATARALQYRSQIPTDESDRSQCQTARLGEGDELAACRHCDASRGRCIHALLGAASSSSRVGDAALDPSVNLSDGSSIPIRYITEGQRNSDAISATPTCGSDAVLQLLPISAGGTIDPRTALLQRGSATPVRSTTPQGDDAGQQVAQTLLHLRAQDASEHEETPVYMGTPDGSPPATQRGCSAAYETSHFEMAFLPPTSSMDVDSYVDDGGVS